MSERSTRHFREQGRALSYRQGSRRRLQNVRLRGNWSPEAIVFLVSMLFILTVVVPWLVQLSPDDLYAPGRPAFRVLR
jgi:hypothetical protein